LSEDVSSFQIAISTGYHEYPEQPPYSPGMLHPEYSFNPQTLINGANNAYEGVRNALRLSQLDIKNYGKKDWNPLGEIINPGDLVVLKPNFVRDFRETQPGDGDCLITHGSIIRAVLDFVFIAIKGNGRIVIADAPQNDADFNMIRQMTGLDEIQLF